jgi:8-oxo-dGTP diphosphatase
MMSEHSLSKPIIKAASACVWRGDKVLLAQRGKTLGYGLWSLPGGKCEPGETTLQAAHRELLEETGIHATLTDHVGDYDIEAGGVRYVISCFSGSFLQGEVAAGSDAMAVQWVAFEQISTLKLATNILDAVNRARHLASV